MKITTGLAASLLATIFALGSMVDHDAIVLAKNAARSQGKTATKLVAGTVIYQLSKSFWRPGAYCLSPIGIKTTNTRSSICLVVTPPFDQVTMYNDRTRSIFQTPLKLFRCPAHKTFVLFNAYQLDEAPMIKVGAGTLAGFNVVKYQTTKAFDQKQLSLRKTDKVPGSNPRIIDSQSTDDFHLPTGAGTSLCRLYGVPIVPGIPIEVSCKDMDLSFSSLLQLKKSAKTRVSAADFALPVGYKRLDSIEEIMKSNDDQDAMQLFGK